MTQREARLAELKKRIAALDDERTAMATEIAALEQTQMLAMPFPNIVSLERVGMLLIDIRKLIRKFRCFVGYFEDVRMSFRSGGTTQNPARAAMRPPVTTNGNAVCAKSLVSNAQCVRIKLSSRSPIISLSGICGVQHQREPPSSWVSIQCCLTEHATCW